MDRSRRFQIGWWLLLMGFPAQMLLGWSIAFGYDSALWSWHRGGMARVFWGSPEVPTVALPIMNQLAAMLGATLSCWGLAMLVLVVIPLRRREAWAWWCILGSALSWFLVDTGLSIHHGVWVNVAFNASAAVMMGVPLLLMWSEVRSWGQR